MKVKKMNLNGEGLHRFFGTLEAKIMEILWSRGKLTIKQVHEIIDRDNPISLNAVMTVMVRLADKGHLLKESSGQGRTKITYFSPTQDKEQFIIEQTKIVTDGLVEDFGSLMVSHLVDNLDKADPELIAKLSRKLEEMKNNR
ncbi:BlaI/MecI/CopY family transcriptional regulator [Paenibacillus barengoltzii]|uniref:BlaI/MecI/CopY family transcriptional regulator n=1 Tax=Paenibacillus timonensis TaxID=225915 RepID=A0ABW3SA66_9BACL|nr:BlaI/MecI/CopY family transcriptional regulator [Paenibacillus timonensis]MCH1638863.1 BlaI/MecI/CopY family transcriptional regulator [Paenibacillus timonensis]